MKMKKRAMSICAIAVGTVILATSAFADAMIGSGYFALKSSIKNTTKTLVNETSNFSADMNVNVKYDQQDIMKANLKTKYDLENMKSESYTEEFTIGNESYNTYSYVDKEKYVNKYTNEKKYYVNYRDKKDMEILTDPFEEEMSTDMENILDAAVGNLKDLVQVEESDGSKIYTGNLVDTQVPTLINAFTSFGVKYSMMDRSFFDESNLPLLTKDIHLVSVSGKAVENSEGILEKIIGSGSLVGKDANGVEHTLSAEFTMSITDVGSTVVNEPEINKDNSIESYDNGRVSEQVYTGIYKHDLIKVTDQQLSKTGEIIFTINSASDDSFEATIEEKYLDGSQGQKYNVTANYNSDVHAYVANMENGESIMIRTDYYNKNDINLNIDFGVKINEKGNGYSTANNNENNGLYVRQFN